MDKMDSPLDFIQCIFKYNNCVQDCPHTKSCFKQLADHNQSTKKINESSISSIFQLEDII